jgi:hypothetical protein
MWLPGAMAGVEDQNSARRRPVWTGEVVGSDKGLTTISFWGLDGERRGRRAPAADDRQEHRCCLSSRWSSGQPRQATTSRCWGAPGGHEDEERGREEGERRARGSGNDGETGDAQRRNSDTLQFVLLTADDKLRDTRECRAPQGLRRGQVAIRVSRTGGGGALARGAWAGRLVLLYGRSARETNGAEGPRQVRGPQRSHWGCPYAGANGRRRVALQDARARNAGRGDAGVLLFLSGLAFFKIAKLTNFEYNSKISKHNSCRDPIGLHLLQRATWCLSNGLSGNVGRSWQNSRPQVTTHSAFNSIFGQFALKIWMSANYEKCVPGNNEELLYWPILNFYSEIWRTRGKTISTFMEI